MNEPDELVAGDGPGPMLRHARESRGLTQQQAAEQLNLDVSVVEALERDDFGRLGAPVFAKGHLRRYGAMLLLVEDELIAAYERAGARPEAPTLVPRARKDMMPVHGRPKWPWMVGGAILFVLAAGLAAYLAEFAVKWPGSSGEPTADAAEAGPAAADMRDLGGELPAEAAVAPGTSVAPASVATDATHEPASPVPPGHVRVKLAFATDSWAEVYDGSGQAVLYDLARAGTQRSIAAAAPLSVTIGNAPGVTLAVNGRPAALPAVPGGGTVARFRIEADGTVR